MSNFEKAKNSHEELMQERYKHRDKTADKMFEELGLHYILEDRDVIKYAEGWVQKEIYFDKINRNITFHDFNIIHEETVLDLKYLIAINEKMKELGWLDE